MFALLNINKPPDWTSRDVVNRVQWLVRPAKAGHAGTLDPLATGVLVVCLGQATRLMEYVQRQRKEYRGTFLLGRESDTEDVDGQVRELPAPPIPSQAEIERVLPGFLGTIQQRPPAYSALKLGGQRAYDLARRGKEVDLAPRPVEIFDLRLVSYEYPELVLDITCGSGTYVRSLGRDIAQAVGSAAVMSALVRRAVGVFRLEEAVELESLTAETIGQALLPARLAVAELPAMEVGEEEILRLVQGKRLTKEGAAAGDEVAALDAAGQLIAILRRTAPAEFQPAKVFSRA